MSGVAVDRLVLAVGAVGCGGSLALHLAILSGAAVAPPPPWSWLLHGGSIAGFWYVGTRITAAGLRGVQSFRQIRRMVPIPARLTLAAATLNTLVTAGLAADGRMGSGRALSAYWIMMYLLITILCLFVTPRVRARPVASMTSDGRP